MITTNDYRRMFEEDRNAARETVKSWREAVKTLDEIQSADRFADETPEHTVKAFVDQVGYATARFVIASLVNRSAWDGRIYPNVSAWASEQDALDEEAARDAMIYTSMHMAHLNQVAQAMMKYEPEIEEKEIDAAVAAEMEEEMNNIQTAEKIVAQVAEKIEQTKTRSAWSRGVKEYAEELIVQLGWAVSDGYVTADDLCNRHLFEEAMLNGASDWKQYSEGGCALIYDQQIAQRLCAPWELRKTDNGRKDPNPHERWIDCQSRALFQAAQLILRAAF